MTAPTKLITAEEFSLRPEREDGCREELVGGVIELAPPPGDRHGEIQLNIGEVLRAFVRTHGLGRVVGEAGYRVARDPDHVLGPDVSFISKVRAERLERVGAYLDGAPDLAIEIVSPSDRADRIQTKVSDYFRDGSLRVWVVYPDSLSVTVHRSDGTAQTLTGDDAITSEHAGFAAEGFEAPIALLFQDAG